ncbi:MAG: TonB family protein [Blastocatellia bacterium]
MWLCRCCADRPANSPALEEASKLSRQAASLFAENKFEEALNLAKQSLELREKVLGMDHELVASSLNIVADIRVAQQKYELADSLYKRSLAVLEKRWGPDSKFLTTTLESLALVRFALRDNGGAEKLYLRSLAIKQKVLGPDAAGTASTLGELGVFYQRIDKHAKAAEFFSRSLTVEERELGPNNPGLLEPLYNCACALFAANKASEAKAYQLRAESIAAAAPIRRSGFVFQGSAILRVEPEYPLQARRDRVSGTVVIEVKVDECGKVIEARALTGHVQLVDGALQAARRWRFARTRLEGRPVKVIGTITFNFNL